MGSTFTAWISDELTKRGWTNAELARRSGLSEGGLSKVLNGERKPNPQTCRQIARGLGVSQVEVFRRAGLITAPSGDDNLTLREIYDFLAEFDDDELDEIMNYIQYRYQLRQRRGQLKPRRSASGG